MSDNPIQKLSESLRTAREQLREIAKKTSSDEKAQLSEIVSDLFNLSDLINDICAFVEKIVKEKDGALEKLVESENWETTKTQYDLKKLRLGVRVFAPNESCKSPKGKHWLCAHCFGNQKKSILQLQKGELINPYAHRYSVFCPGCKTSLDVDVEDFRDYNVP